MVEVTCRTMQGRFLIKPTVEMRRIIIGVLTQAQRFSPVQVHAFVFLSNHYHLLLSVDDSQQLARFMNYLNSNLAREAGRLHGWREKFWGRRYQAIVVSDEEAAQMGRLRYLLSHGCKEGLVARPRDWPGAHSARALVEDRSLNGLWFDRTKEYAARVRGKKFDRLKYAKRVRMRLEPLPCWRHHSRDEYQERIAELVGQIESDTASRHAQEGTRPLGVKAVLAQNSSDRPVKLKRALAPAFHAVTRTARQDLVESYRWFVSAYRSAAKRLSRGEHRPCFPSGSFPPRLPFVGWIPDS